MQELMYYVLTYYVRLVSLNPFAHNIHFPKIYNTYIEYKKNALININHFFCEKTKRLIDGIKIIKIKIHVAEFFFVQQPTET